jgi:hypothetical protein
LKRRSPYRSINEIDFFSLAAKTCGISLLTIREFDKFNGFIAYSKKDMSRKEICLNEESKRRKHLRF